MAVSRRSELWRVPKTARAVERELARVGSRLREARIREGLTIESLAERAGIHPVSLSRVETGNVNVTIATLVALCRALSIELATLFERV